MRDCSRRIAALPLFFRVSKLALANFVGPVSGHKSLTFVLPLPWSIMPQGDALGGLFHVQPGCRRGAMRAALMVRSNLVGAMSPNRRAAARVMPRGPGESANRTDAMFQELESGCLVIGFCFCPSEKFVGYGQS
jgi:hypothetical protein